jgi:hypothetical protein
MNTDLIVRNKQMKNSCLNFFVKYGGNFVAANERVITAC